MMETGEDNGALSWQGCFYAQLGCMRVWRGDLQRSSLRHCPSPVPSSQEGRGATNTLPSYPTAVLRGGGQRVLPPPPMTNTAPTPTLHLSLLDLTWRPIILLLETGLGRGAEAQAGVGNRGAGAGPSSKFPQRLIHQPSERTRGR